MNALKRLLAVMLVGGAGFGLFVACGGEETSCTFDADCADGEACEGTVCVPTCTTDDDCLDGEECGEGVNTEQNVCKVSGDSNNTNNNGTTNNTTSTNNGTTPATLYYTVAITSTTTEAAACGDVSDPGPDIFGVGLEDTQGNPLGWGVIDYDGIQFDGNDEVDTGVIDGNAPEVGADGCPDTFAGNVVALGCEGSDEGSYIVVSFVGADGNPVALDATAGQAIRVYEYGGVCSTGSTDDTYNLDICTDTDASKGGDISSCTISLLIDAAGEESNEVAGF